MVKPKQQRKISHKKQHHPQNKKPGKPADTSQFRSQLDALGLRIVDITADGNCFFRALADQLEGNEEGHQKYRSMVVKHIMDNREMFEPFIEDEVPFDEYCQTMENDGTWAGHMELQAASLVLHSNICIHRNMSPRWYVRNFDDCRARMIHLSYHDGEHYNSVRLKDDPCDGPARSIVIKVLIGILLPDSQININSSYCLINSSLFKADADLSATSHQAKVTANKAHAQAGRESFQPGSIKLVMAGSGCENTERVEQILEQVNGDIDAAIEFLIAEQGEEEWSTKCDSSPIQADAYGHDKNENSEQQKENIVENSINAESSKSSRKTNERSTCQQNDTKISRNKMCPCGSKKKYKACCGTTLARQSARFVVNQAAESRRSKRDSKQGKKGVSSKADVSGDYDSVTPDMGALCI
ncbi:OTU domain-containing protein 3 isoform X2 [Arachis ipaensis]|uniref:OTU domain-containing protein 3 isoform X2 n=1 Tax=Arachis ipaensis TaxID=130454 RepID=UPI0007AF9193|nr:OTU domain-containing protein 3 isoform X2 [Arachis ipaensis]XP_025627257.1 OTU domain-containing protein 3 isoform X2 [Arachis hypogaea]QHO19296.1 OTU domain-containing protein [Arachis hypogaea]